MIASPRPLAWLVVFCLAAMLADLQAWGQDAPTEDRLRAPSWELWTPEQMVGRLADEWRTLDRLDEAQLADRSSRLLSWLQADHGDSELDRLTQWLVNEYPGLRSPLESFLAASPARSPALAQQLCNDFSSHPLLANHLRLVTGRHLRQRQLYEEALAQLIDLDPEDTLVPQRLLFERMLIYHQLAQRTACLTEARLLLERQAQLPRRFSVLAQSALRDMEALQSDSLDEISRLMQDVGRRMALNRSGTQVIEQEQTIVGKLDKLIEQLEQQQAMQAGQASGAAPDQAMEDSLQTQTMGSGEVIEKELAEGGAWGNLPPAERAAALAEMARDLPPHYRTAIEEFFRRLAGDDR